MRGVYSHVISIFTSSVLDPDCTLEKWFMLSKNSIRHLVKKRERKKEMHTRQGDKIALWFLPFYLRAMHLWTSPRPLCASVSSPVKWVYSNAAHQRVARGLAEVAHAECFGVSCLVTQGHIEGPAHLHMLFQLLAITLL